MKNWSMTRSTMIAAMVMFTFITVCSGNNDQQSEHKAQSRAMPDDMRKMSHKEMSEIEQNEGLQTVLNNYMQIKSALVADNSEQVQKAAASMQGALKQTDSNELDEEIKNTVSQLVEAQDISTQRKYFAQLSDQLYQLVKNSDAVDQTLYWQHCPMALDNQGQLAEL